MASENNNQRPRLQTGLSRAVLYLAAFGAGGILSYSRRRTAIHP